MTVKINLLPKELRGGASFLKIEKIIKSLTLIVMALFSAFILVAGSVLVFSSLQLRNTLARNKNLQEEIASLEESEQVAIFLKDRISKIKITRSTKSPVAYLDQVILLISSLSSGDLVSSMTLNAKNIDLTLNFASVDNLKTFLTFLQENDNFSSVVLMSLGRNAQGGYSLSLKLTPKI